MAGGPTEAPRGLRGGSARAVSSAELSQGSVRPHADGGGGSIEFPLS